MGSLLSVLQWLQLAVFLGAAVATARLWLRRRSSPPGYLAAAFTTLAAALLLARVPTDGLSSGAASLLGDLALAGLMLFPWLLTLFAWSFERPFPRWLTLTGLVVVGLAAWTLVLPPLPEAGEPTTAATTAFVAIFVSAWVALGGLAAWRLWCAGGDQPVIRARMRLMASGALLLTAAILGAAFTVGGLVGWLRPVANGLAVLAAALFLGAFAPPRPLRMWWRRGLAEHWQDMQLHLIAAVTRTGAAQAVAPVLADVVGGSAAVIDDDGTVLAAAGFDEPALREFAWQVSTGGPLRARRSNWC